MGETYIVYHRVCRPIGYRHGRYFGFSQYEADMRLDRMYAGTCRKYRRVGYFGLTRMERALWKFGPESFDTVVIERDTDRAHCLALEAWHQLHHDTLWPNGLNTVAWASGGRISDEACAKISANNGMRRPDVRAKLGVSMREAFKRPEVRARMSASLREAYARPEVRAKVSASVRAALQTPEARAKMGAGKRARRLLRRVRELQARRFVPDPLITQQVLALAATLPRSGLQPLITLKG